MKTALFKFIYAGALLLSLSLQAAPQPKPEPAGMLSIDSTPSHADIYIDRVNRAQTPAEITLTPGQHLVTLRAEGCKPEHHTVMIDDGGRTSLNVQLEKITGILIVASEPKGAEITVEGISYGTTPALITTLPLGTYQLALSLSGYKPKTVEVAVKDRTPVKTEVSLVSDTAELKIECDVPDVAISLNGIPRGTAPCTIDRIPAGEVELEAKAKGYKPFLQKIKLGEGEVQSVNIIMEVQPAALKVVSIPDKSRVYIDNNFKGETPLTIAEIDAGTHRVRVEHEGYDPNARNLELTAGEELIEEFRLAANTGKLLLTTNPDGVTVILNGKEYGTTPPAKDQGQGISAPYSIDALPAGTYTLKAVKPGFFEKTAEVVIERGNTTTQNITLQRKFIPNYEVITAQGTFKGVLESITPDGIRLERSPGITAFYGKDQIIRHGRLPDSAK